MGPWNGDIWNPVYGDWGICLYDEETDAINDADGQNKALAGVPYFPLHPGTRIDSFSYLLQVRRIGVHQLLEYGGRVPEWLHRPFYLSSDPAVH